MTNQKIQIHTILNDSGFDAIVIDDPVFFRVATSRYLYAISRGMADAKAENLGAVEWVTLDDALAYQAKSGLILMATGDNLDWWQSGRILKVEG